MTFNCNHVIKQKLLQLKEWPENKKLVIRRQQHGIAETGYRGENGNVRSGIETTLTLTTENPQYTLKDYSMREWHSWIAPQPGIWRFLV